MPVDGTTGMWPRLGNSPNVRSWSESDLGQHWRPPACTGWTAAGFSTLITTAARFRYISGVEGLLQHIGAPSTLWPARSPVTAARGDAVDLLSTGPLRSTARWPEFPPTRSLLRRHEGKWPHYLEGGAPTGAAAGCRRPTSTDCNRSSSSSTLAQSLSLVPVEPEALRSW